MALEARRIVDAFRVFDLDGDGFISSEELMTVLTRPCGTSAMSREDAEDFIKLFDISPNGGRLGLKEFGAAWGMYPSFLGDGKNAFEQAQLDASRDAENARYDACVAPYKDQIASLFRRLDVSETDGNLTANELKGMHVGLVAPPMALLVRSLHVVRAPLLEDVVALYQGEAFDKDSFFEWYDVHHTGSTENGPDGSLDLREFGWYIADCASCEDARMPSVITAFGEAIDYMISKGGAQLPKSPSRPSLFRSLTRKFPSMSGRRSR